MLLIMPTVIEPIGAGLAVALINKFIINNPSLWETIWGCGKPHHDDSNDDASSNTTSVNDAEIHVHHM